MKARTEVLWSRCEKNREKQSKSFAVRSAGVLSSYFAEMEQQDVFYNKQEYIETVKIHE